LLENEKQPIELKLSESLYYKSIEFINKFFCPAMDKYNFFDYEYFIDFLEIISNLENYLPNDNFEFIYMCPMNLIAFTIKDDGLIYAIEKINGKISIELISSGKWL
jgi:hypothetical protein